MFDFNRYFLPDRKIFLDNVQYELIQFDPKIADRKMNCNDILLAQRTESRLKVTFNRTLSFDPEGPFRLSVTFGVLLPFDPEVKDEVDWNTIDLAGEFRNHCRPTLTGLMSRASLLISQITSASGQNPLVTPGSPTSNPV